MPSSTLQNRACIIAGGALFLLLLCFCYCMFRLLSAARIPQGRRQCQPRHTISRPENFTVTQTINTIRYQGAYKLFQGLWHRVEGGFTGVRTNYLGYSTEHLNNAVANAVWLHEGGALAIYDQHVYAHAGKKVATKMVIWSIGRWNPENGGVVHTDRNAYAIVDVANTPSGYPAENLITMADVYGGSGWGGVSEAESGGSFMAVDSSENSSAPPAAPPPAAAPPAAAAPPPAAALTSPSKVLQWMGVDERLGGLWHWQREGVWYNERNNLALMKGPSLGGGHQWRIQAWTPEQDRLGVATGGVLLSTTDGTLTGGSEALSVATRDGQGFQPFEPFQPAMPQANTISNYTAFAYRPQVIGYTAGARRRVELKDRVAISTFGRQGAVRNTAIQSN
jgi:hypothetical protein